MKLRRTVFVFSLLLALMIPALCLSQVIAVKAGYIVNPETASLQKNGVILIKEAKITNAGTNVKIPDGAVVYDLSAKYVLPGLFDCHTHLCEKIPAAGNIGNSFRVEYLLNTTADRALQGVENAREFLMAGFTTVRDVGNAGNFADIAVKRAIKRGKFPGPNMLVSGKIIAPRGGQLHVNYEHLDYPLIDYIEADTKDEMRKGIRLNLHLGADWIKIVVDDQRYIYSPEDIRFIVEESAAAGVKVCAHCVTEQGAINAIKGGVASIEHGFFMSDETIAMAVKKGIWLCGTEFSKEAWAVYRAEKFYPVLVGRLKRAYNAGLRMAFGSDLVIEVPGYDRGHAALTLLDSWLDAQVPDQDILKAMTADAAEMLDMKDTRGAIKAGYIADIIAVPDNPLKDIKTLRKVSFVMKEGKVYKN